MATSQTKPNQSSVPQRARRRQVVSQPGDNLPDDNSPDLHLSHPTPEECVKISTETSTAWRDSLSESVYLEECQFLSTVPLAKDGGLTSWILVEKHLPPNERQILCSCESYRKRALTSDNSGNVKDAIVHGVASVFCPPLYRSRGYASRMMKELAIILRNWQEENMKVIGSTLYSDIGKDYYAKLGWKPNRTNFHVEFESLPNTTKPHIAKEISSQDIPGLCTRDEDLLRAVLAKPKEVARVAIVPDSDHMFWHLAKEDFACEHNFGKAPYAKGAIAGPPGRQIWALWTHRYYGPPGLRVGVENVLYILRLVIEDEGDGGNDLTKTLNTVLLKAVLQAAQAEAGEWDLGCVKLWDPSPLVLDMIEKGGIEYLAIEREEECIASCLWYDENGDGDEAPLWVNNEHYAWC